MLIIIEMHRKRTINIKEFLHNFMVGRPLKLDRADHVLRKAAINPGLNQP